MTNNKFIKNIYNNVFSLNFLYEIIRNIFTIVAIGVVFYFIFYKYPLNTEYLSFSILLFIGIASYFGFPVLSKYINKIGMSVNRIYYNINFFLHKKQARKDLNSLMKNTKNFNQRNIIEALGTAFLSLPDKEQVWKDLFLIAKNSDGFLQISAIELMGVVFPYIPDRKQAWCDLLTLTQDNNVNLRQLSINVIGTTFPNLPNKKLAWSVLIRLIQDKEIIKQNKSLYAFLSEAPKEKPEEKSFYDRFIELTEKQQKTKSSVDEKNMPFLFNIDYIDSLGQDWSAELTKNLGIKPEENQNNYWKIRLPEDKYPRNLSYISGHAGQGKTDKINRYFSKMWGLPQIERVPLKLFISHCLKEEPLIFKAGHSYLVCQPESEAEEFRELKKILEHLYETK